MMDELGKRILEPMSKMVKRDRGDFLELMEHKDKIYAAKMSKCNIKYLTKT